MNLHQHISAKFEKELAGLRNDILKMGQLLAKQLEEVVLSIDKKKPRKNKIISKHEQQINELEGSLDTKCVNLLALHSPTASDLRFIIGVSRMVNDLESMGDEITKTSFTLQKMLEKSEAGKDYHLYADLKNIADELLQLLLDTLHAYEEENTEAAAKLIIKEREMDILYQNATRARITWIMEDPGTVKIAVHVFWMLRSMERIGKCIRQVNNHHIFVQKGTDTRHMSSEKVKDKFIKRKKSVRQKS